MTTLTPAQIALLREAAAPDGAPAPERGRTAANLIKRGLLLSLPRAGEPSRLSITTAGREMVGLPNPLASKGGGAAVKSAAPAPGKPSSPGGKLGQLVTLLRRAEGARINELCAATGWQAHSVRGVISGTVKKKLGLTVSSTAAEPGRVYRIVDGAGA